MTSAPVNLLPGYRLFSLRSQFISLCSLCYEDETVFQDENDIPEFELLIPPGRYQAFIFNKNIITANPGNFARLITISFSLYCFALQSHRSMKYLKTKLIYNIIKIIPMILVHVCPRVSCGSLQQHMEDCGSWSLTDWPSLL